MTSESTSKSVVLPFIAITISYFAVFLTSQFFYFFRPDLLFIAQRICFIAIALFFMKVFDYSIFNNWRADLCFSLFILSMLSYLSFVDKAFAVKIDVLLLAPLTEEFFFRGFMIGLVFKYAIMESNALVRITAIVGSMIVSLCGFTLMHAPKNYLYALHFGFLLSVIMIAYRSLLFSKLSDYAVVFPMIPHFLNNLLFELSNAFRNSALGNFAIFLTVLLLMMMWSTILYKNIKAKLDQDF